MTVAQLIKVLKKYNPDVKISIPQLKANDNAVNNIETYKTILGEDGIELSFTKVLYAVEEF